MRHLLQWYAAFGKDPTGKDRKLVPVRVERCELEGLVPQIVYIDLVGLDEKDAEDKLLSGVKRERAKPTERPPYPAASAPPSLETVCNKPPFPPDRRILGDDFVWVSPGVFHMGSPESEMFRQDEQLHVVTLTQGFYISRYPVTQHEFDEVMGLNPSYSIGPRHPVECVSWHDAMKYCGRRTEQDVSSDKLPKHLSYTLPTEAQWESACRAGTSSTFYFGDDASMLTEFAVFDQNSHGRTCSVGDKRPNPFGLFDMYGNVWEWCVDWYEEYTYDRTSDPRGPMRGTSRVLRGGSYRDSCTQMRSAARGMADPYTRNQAIGFRIATTAEGITKP